MSDDNVYICREPKYTEERDGIYLLIWPDIPNWMVLDEEGVQFVTAVQGEHTMQEIVTTFQSIAGSSVSREEMDEFIDNMVKTQVLYKKGEPPSGFSPGTQKIQSIILYPTSRCNLRCLMCYNKDNLTVSPDGELSAQEFCRFLDEVEPFLADQRTNVQILGGEPLVVPDKTLTIMEHASSLVDHVSVSTNGTLVTEEFARRASSIEKTTVQVSLDSPYRKDHETLRGKGTYKKTLAGIRLLVNHGVKTTMNMVCHQDNLNQLKGYYELAGALGVARVRFIPLQQAGAGITCGLKPPSYRDLIQKGLHLFKTHPHFKKFMGADFVTTMAGICKNCSKQGWCGTGLRVVMLDAEGTVYPCPNHLLPEFKVGTIRETKFEEMWNTSPVFKKIRETYPVEVLNEKCASCEVRHWCVGWCRGETYQVTKSMTQPSILCEEIKQMLVDMFFFVSLESDVFGQIVKVFDQPQDLKRL